MKTAALDRRVSRSFSLSLSLQERLDRYADRKKMKVSRVAEQALQLFLDRKDRKRND